MNILRKLTLQNLKLNKKRTIVTAIGIILSVGLITGVAAIATSFHTTYINYCISQTGNYHYTFYNVPSSDLTVFENNRNIQNTFILKDAGYSPMDASNTSSKKFMRLIGGTENDFKNLNWKIKEGRYPENADEIVVSSKYSQKNKQIGEKIELSIGRLMWNGEEVDTSEGYMDGEEVQTEYTKTYTIVGFLDESSGVRSWMPDEDCLIYDAHQDQGNYTVYARYTRQGLKKDYQTTAEIIGVDADLLLKFFDTERSSDNVRNLYEQIQQGKYHIERNESLIMAEDLRFGTNEVATLFGVAAVVIAIIMITSIYCIKNSFDISITDRIHEYGMLRSIGATKKQIRKSVLNEALIMSIFSIPLGICLGLLFNLILVYFANNALQGIADIKMKYDASFLTLLCSALAGLVTVVLSAVRSARRANRIDPLTAIRGNEDIKINTKMKKTPRYIRKWFGVSGIIAYKNAQRDKKKYRTTVVSIVLCTATFISMSYIINTAIKTTSLQYSNKNYNMTVHYSYDSSEIENCYQHEDEIYRCFGDAPYEGQYTGVAMADDVNFTSEYNDLMNDFYLHSSGYERRISLVLLDEGTYQNYLKQLGLQESEARDKAILVNNTFIRINNKKELMQKTNYKAGDTISVKIPASQEDVYKSFDEKYTESRTIELAAVTDMKIGSYVDYPQGIDLIVSPEYFRTFPQNFQVTCYANVVDPDATIKDLNHLQLSHLQTTSLLKQQQDSNNVYMMFSVFLYGFIAIIASIGITSIINTITSNMQQRQKEFASLKSIGMTRKEFNQMVSMESLLYGTRSLLIGIPIGIVISIITFYIIQSSVNVGYLFPWSSILISIAAVSILLLSIMRYSISRINHQNMIETIRSENI